MYQLYHPESDPLVQRARKRNRRLNPLLICLVVGLIGWVVFREFIQPRLGGLGGTTNVTTPRLIEARSPESRSAPVLVEARRLEHFSVGQAASYGISADVKGKGTPAMEGTTGLRLGFETDLDIEVTSVLEHGAATMVVRFGDANIYGNRFGYPIGIQRRAGVTQSFATSATPVVTAMNKNYDGPDLTEFDTPVVLNLAPDGSPQGESDVGRVGRLLGALFRLSGTSFPQSELQPGMTWARDVVFTLPGMDYPVAAKVTSTLVGGADYYGFPCVQIENTLEPTEAETASLLPSMAAARALGHIEVSGRGTTYYDPVSRTMVWAQSEFNVDLILAESLDSVSELMGSYSGILGELEGGPAFNMGNYLKTAGTVPIGLHIQISIARKK